MNERIPTTIGAHCTVTSSKRFHLSERSNSGVPFFCSKEIIQRVNGQDITECDYIREELYEQVKSQFGVPQAGDLLITTRGTYGVPYLYRKTDRFYFADGNLTWLKDFDDKLLPEYLYYWVKSPEGQGKIDAIAKGTAQKAVPIEAVKALRLSIPTIVEQQQIAAILSAYNALIETNQRQIKLLEEAAQRLYKEWFVDLRFPGYEGVPVVDGVPEGWKRTTVSQCLSHHINGGWGKDSPVGKNIIPGRVIRGTDINDVKGGHYSDIPLRFHTENDIAKRVLMVDDIVFELSNGNIDNIGRTLLIDDFILERCGKNTICASFCKLFRPIDTLHALSLYWEIQDMQLSGRMKPFKKQGSNGINNFAFEDFLNHSFLVPDEYHILRHLEMIMCKISNLQRQQATLSEARDRLLPKLINGEIEV